MAGRIFHCNHPRYKLGTRFLAPSFSAMATASSRLPTIMSKCAICCCFPASSGQVGGHLCILKGQTKTARQFKLYIMFIAFDHLPIKKLCIKIGQRILIGRIQYNGAYKKSVHKRSSLSFSSVLLSSQMLRFLPRRYHPFIRFPISLVSRFLQPQCAKENQGLGTPPNLSFRMRHRYGRNTKHAIKCSQYFYPKGTVIFCATPGLVGERQPQTEPFPISRNKTQTDQASQTFRRKMLAAQPCSLQAIVLAPSKTGRPDAKLHPALLSLLLFRFHIDLRGETHKADPGLAAVELQRRSILVHQG